MLVVKVEFHNANTGDISEIARMTIVNDATGTMELGNYDCRAVHSEPPELVATAARVVDHPRAEHVWKLVLRALQAAFQ